MGKVADRNGRDLLAIGRAKGLHIVKPANGDIRELPARRVHEIDVISDRTGVDHMKHLEWRLSRKHHHLAGVFQGHPDLLAVGRRSDVRAEWRDLRDTPDDLVRLRADYHSFGGKAGAHIAIASIGRKDGHARPIRDLDARFLTVARAVEHSDVVLATHRYPDFAAVLGEERLVWRASHIGC